MVTPADRESAAVTEHLWFAAFICGALAAIIAYFRAWWYVLPIILILLLLSFLKPSRHYPLGGLLCYWQLLSLLPDYGTSCKDPA